MKMERILNQTVNPMYAEASTGTSLWSKFMIYCKGQEKNRLMWVGIILAAHGCVITPITAMITYFAGQSFVLFMVAMAAMGIALVTNLAAMPARITIPTFVLSILIDLAVIISCVVMIV